MTRYQSEFGTTLGVTFYGGKEKGKMFFLSPTEVEEVFTLAEDTKVLSDNMWSGTVGELLDMFKTCTEATAEDMKSRGWGDRLESGLHLRTSVSDDGNTFFTL